MAWTVNFADQKGFFSLLFVEAGLKKSEGRNSVCFFGFKHLRPQTASKAGFSQQQGRHQSKGILQKPSQRPETASKAGI
jgi:hypothetical protein